MNLQRIVLNQTLKAYYREQSPEAQRELFDYDDGQGNAAHYYAHHVVEKFQSEMGSVYSRDFPPISPIQTHEPPRYFDTEKTYRSLGSLIALNWGLMAVDALMKSIIEKIEPNIHQFLPIEIRMPRNSVYPGPYYVLAIGRYLDSLEPEKCSDGIIRAIPDSKRYSHVELKAGIVGLALSKQDIGSAHLWRERRLSRMPTFFSDTLQAEISNANLRIPKHYKIMEV